MMALVCVTGGREFHEVKLIWYTLDVFHKQIGIDNLISGMARGTDSIAVEWAKAREIIYTPKWPDYKKYQPWEAPLKRNIAMCKMKPDWLIEFPGGTGTAHMVRSAHKYGIEVINYKQVWEMDPDNWKPMGKTNKKIPR
ncbi:MAG: DUF2493 domain-containing protein [Bacteroidota bacterium]